MRWLVGVALAVAMLACSSDSGPVGKDALLESPAIETLEKAWQWPPEGGTARDVRADDLACRKTAHQWERPLRILTAYGECMADLGWTRLPDERTARAGAAE